MYPRSIKTKIKAKIPLGFVSACGPKKAAFEIEWSGSPELGIF